jgi:hypothetical protein
MVPLLRNRCGSAAWVVYIVPSRLVCTILVHSAVSAPRIGPTSIRPALFTSTSSLPKCSTVAATAARHDCSSVTSKSSVSTSPGARQPVGTPRADRYFRAGLRQRQRGRLADTRRGPGDFSLQRVIHAMSSSIARLWSAKA